ncbi:unnamed protein product [Diplocarpon coronariae]
MATYPLTVIYDEDTCEPKGDRYPTGSKCLGARSPRGSEGGVFGQELKFWSQAPNHGTRTAFRVSRATSLGSKTPLQDWSPNLPPWILTDNFWLQMHEETAAPQCDSLEGWREHVGTNERYLQNVMDRLQDYKTTRRPARGIPKDQSGFLASAGCVFCSFELQDRWKPLDEGRPHHALVNQPAGIRIISRTPQAELADFPKRCYELPVVNPRRLCQRQLLPLSERAGKTSRIDGHDDTVERSSSKEICDGRDGQMRSPRRHQQTRSRVHCFAGLGTSTVLCRCGGKGSPKSFHSKEPEIEASPRISEYHWVRNASKILCVIFSQLPWNIVRSGEPDGLTASLEERIVEPRKEMTSDVTMSIGRLGYSGLEGDDI